MVLSWLDSEVLSRAINMKLLILVILLNLEYLVSSRRLESTWSNDRPIIGILAQEQSYYLSGKYSVEDYTSYIAGSYVKSVECAGARVVPLMIGKDRTYYEDLLTRINGVLFPGGATYFNQSNGYADAGEHIYQIAKEMNDRGDYFPLFGTCLGFQLLTVLSANRVEVRSDCSASDVNYPLIFDRDYRDSRMYRKAPKDVIRMLGTENITLNAHIYCITDDTLKNFNLTDEWRALTYNYDENKFRFISSFEHKRYPFYGVQFHPEKASFEWKSSKAYPHSRNAIVANRYFMDFFVEESTRNNHCFESTLEEREHMIYNFNTEYTGKIGSAFETCYFFEPRGVV